MADQDPQFTGRSPLSCEPTSQLALTDYVCRLPYMRVHVHVMYISWNYDAISKIHLPEEHLFQILSQSCLKWWSLSLFLQSSRQQEQEDDSDIVSVLYPIIQLQQDVVDDLWISVHFSDWVTEWRISCSCELRINIVIGWDWFKNGWE